MRKNIFFFCRKYSLQLKNMHIPVIPSIFLLICKLINISYGSGIPVNENVKKFIAPHGFYGVFISKQAKIGCNNTIYQQVTIGLNDKKNSNHYGAPTIGNNVYIGAGAKIIGNITIGNNVNIGANCIVTENIKDNCTVVMNHPRILEK